GQDCDESQPRQGGAGQASDQVTEVGRDGAGRPASAGQFSSRTPLTQVSHLLGHSSRSRPTPSFSSRSRTSHLKTHSHRCPETSHALVPFQMWAKCGHEPLPRQSRSPAIPVFPRALGASTLAVTVGFELSAKEVSSGRFVVPARN